MSFPSLFTHDLIKTYGARRVLDGVSLVAYSGQRLGLVDEIGVGKSTLLRLLAGIEEPDAGEASRPADNGFLHQEPPFDGGTNVEQLIEAAVAETRDAERRVQGLAEELRQQPDDPEVLAAYGEVLEWAETHEIWDAERRAGLILAGLGLDGVARGRKLESLSGGERSRLALAELLLRRPRALLLDEPTNHLSLALVEELEEALRTAPGAIVVATHDRRHRRHWQGYELRPIAGHRAVPEDTRETELPTAVPAR